MHNALANAPRNELLIGLGGNHQGIECGGKLPMHRALYPEFLRICFKWKYGELLTNFPCLPRASERGWRRGGAWLGEWGGATAFPDVPQQLSAGSSEPIKCSVASFRCRNSLLHFERAVRYCCLAFFLMLHHSILGSRSQSRQTRLVANTLFIGMLYKSSLCSEFVASFLLLFASSSSSSNGFFFPPSLFFPPSSSVPILWSQCAIVQITVHQRAFS